MEMEETQIIVLSKTPYQESDLIVSGVSPDAGKLSLLLRGARKVEAKKYPFADIFRELEVAYVPSDRTELFSVRELALSLDFSAVAEQPEHFAFAGKIGGFVLANSAPSVAMPLTYDALKNILTDLAQLDGETVWSVTQMAVIIKLTLLYENGLLPGYSGGSEAEARALELYENIINAGIDRAPLPEFAPEYWNRLNHYLGKLVVAGNLVWG